MSPGSFGTPKNTSASMWVSIIIRVIWALINTEIGGVIAELTKEATVHTNHIIFISIGFRIIRTILNAIPTVVIRKSSLALL